MELLMQTVNGFFYGLGFWVAAAIISKVLHVGVLG